MSMQHETPGDYLAETHDTITASARDVFGTEPFDAVHLAIEVVMKGGIPTRLARLVEGGTSPPTDPMAGVREGALAVATVALERWEVDGTAVPLGRQQFGDEWRERYRFT